MSTSFVQQIQEQEKRYIGQTQIYSSSVSTITDGPYSFDITISSQTPVPEKSHVILDIFGVSSVDSQGTIYGGHFQVRKNASNGSFAIEISGDSLTTTQIDVIKNSISLTENSIRSIFEISLIPIAASGAKLFTITIPYDETSIHSQFIESVIPFLSFDGSNINTTAFSNPINVVVEPSSNKMVIDAGLLVRNTDLISISNNIATSRHFTKLDLSLPSATSQITLDYIEDLTSRPAITFVPYIYGFNILGPHPDGAGWCVSLSTSYYKTVSDTSPTYRYVKFHGQYGLSKSDGNNGLLPVDIMQVSLYAGTQATFEVYETPTEVPTVRVIFDDTNAPLRNAISIKNNYTYVFQEISFDIANHKFKIIGYNNLSVLKTYVYTFTDTTTLSQLVSDVKSQLLAQFPEWYNALVFTVTERFLFGKCVHLNATSSTLTNIQITEEVFFYLRPPVLNTPTSFITRLHIPGVEPHPPFVVGIRDLATWFYDTFGSYGVIINWLNTPNTDNWRGLSLFGVFYRDTQPVAPVIISQNNIPIDYKFTARQNFYNNTPGELGRQTVTLTIPVTTYPVQTVTYLANNIMVLLRDQFPYFLSNANLPIPPVTIQIQGEVIYGDLPLSILEDNYVTDESSIPIDFLSNSSTIHNTFSYIKFQSGTFSNTVYINLDTTPSISDLVNYINSNTAYNQFIKAKLVDPAISNTSVDYIDPKEISVSLLTNSINLTGNTLLQIVKSYSFSQYQTLPLLVDAINLDWSAAQLVVTIDPSVSLHSDAIPFNFIANSQIVSEGIQPKLFTGVVSAIAVPPEVPTVNVDLNFDIEFTTTTATGEPSGVQVALGGYEKDGTFYPNTAPNAFFEPVYNTFFPIVFNTINADIVYLLVKTRNNILGTSFTSNPSHYSGLVTYSNNVPNYTIHPFIPTSSKFTNVWNEGGTLGVPVVITVPASSPVMNVSIEDTSLLESINLQIINTPDSLSTFGFLAINRTNNNQSQTESKIGDVYGLVLDNRGAWDVLISPEATLRLDSSGPISHLGSSYERTVLNDDEGYDLILETELPDELASSISVSPVPGFPQIWIFRIEYGLKKYLGTLKNSNSTSGCSFDFDFAVRGRSTGIEGVFRITVFYDYTCVFDTQLCDTFWNLIEPPKPASEEIIQNNLTFSYDTLIGCNNLTTIVNNNTAINVPILITISNIPTFKNGNALLLIKSTYTPEIQGFYFPINNELDDIQLTDCSQINANVPLMQKLNKEFLLLPNQDVPINDIFQIRNLISTEDSYLWVRPQFYFPPSDDIEDCGENEIVLVGIGYQFKNWDSGTRQDSVIIGLNMVLPHGVFTAPDMNICYRYYYKQSET